MSMSGTINGSPRISETSVNQSGSSMHFWGVCCESGKQYAQVVGQRFRITMAVLDPKSFQNDSREKVVSLIVLRGGIEYLLCILKHGEIHQVNLNLIFDKGENVKFYINGHGKVYLSGYQLTDSEGDVVNDENGYLCPLVEVQSKSKKSKADKASASPLDTEPVASTSKQHNKKTKKALWSSYISETIGEDEIESDEDVDFSVSDEESDDYESSDDIAPSELEDLTRDILLDSDDEDSDVKVQNATDSRKRRLQEKSSSQKRSRADIQNSSSSMENEEDVICVEDNGFEVSSTSNFSVNSAGNTPMPKKHRNSEAPFGEKMSKKEKRLKELLKTIDHLDDSQEIAEISSSKSPKQAVANSSKSGKYPLVKLEGGVEIQDVIVGKGPEAINGKMLHIFFVGRLPDNEIFDSRTPGSKPFSFRLGNSEVIKGWEVAIKGMRVGGRRKMKIPPPMAYGARGASNIPAGATLRFLVDLQSVS